MRNSQSQVQTQAQLQQQRQVLSPQQLLVASLVALSAEDLKERVENECLENPWLESKSLAPSAPKENGEVYDARKDYRSEDDIPDYLLRQQHSKEDASESLDYADTLSFYDHLKEQVGEYDVSEHEREILEYLIGSLDDDGLLKKPLYQVADELEIYHSVPTSEQEVERLLGVLQSFDPPGIGARSLQECLMLQTPKESVLYRVLRDEWDAFTKKKWDSIAASLSLTEAQVETCKHEVHRLNPRPGGALGELVGKNQEQIRPDFIVEVSEEGKLSLTLNEGDIPALSVSEDAAEMISDAFVRGYVEKGRMFIDAMVQRRKTLLKTMKAIVQRQRGFFQSGDEMTLVPMRLEDIAEKTEQDVSTVSRVTSQRFVQTPYGTYPLKWFFSGISQQDGEDVSSRKLKAMLRELIDAEDKNSPLSDDTLCQMLKEKHGYEVARRTIAKYREQMGIPTSRMRKS